MTLLVSLASYILVSLHLHTFHASHIFTITTLHTLSSRLGFEKPFIISFITLRFIQPKINELFSRVQLFCFHCPEPNQSLLHTVLRLSQFKVQRMWKSKQHLYTYVSSLMVVLPAPITMFGYYGLNMVPKFVIPNVPSKFSLFPQPIYENQNCSQ